LFESKVISNLIRIASGNMTD